MMQLMMLLKRNNVNGNSGNQEEARIPISKKSCKPCCDAKQQAQSEHFRNMNTMTDIRFPKQLGQLKIPIKM